MAIAAAGFPLRQFPSRLTPEFEVMGVYRAQGLLWIGPGLERTSNATCFHPRHPIIRALHPGRRASSRNSTAPAASPNAHAAIIARYARPADAA